MDDDMENTPRWIMGTGTYKDESCKILYFGHVPIEDAHIRIGNFSSIAANVEFFIDGNHRFDHASSFPFYELGYCQKNILNKNGYGKGAPKVGHDVWIGRGAMIMSGVTIGNGCVIGARTVVTKDCPPYSVVVGNPGKIIRYRFSKPIIERFQKVEWWNFSLQDITTHLAPFQHDFVAFLKKAEEHKNQNVSSTCTSVTFWTRVLDHVHHYLSFGQQFPKV